MNKSLLYIVDPYNATYGVHARATIYKEMLKKSGWNVRYVCLKPFPPGYERLLDKDIELLHTVDEVISIAQGFSIVYLVKCMEPELVWQLRRRTKSYILYDVYDNIWDSYSTIIKDIFSNIDVFISEGSYAETYITRYQKPVFDLKSVCVYSELFKHHKEIHDNRVVIGWIGSESTISAVYSVLGALENIVKKYEYVDVLIVGARINTTNIPRERLNMVPKYTFDDMLRYLSIIDIGLFPPPSTIEDYIIRGPHKGIRYMGAYVPAVFYRAGDCMDFVVDGENAFLYDNIEEFEKKVSLLIEDSALRIRIGNNGFDTVNDLYSMEHSFKCLSTILESILLMKFQRFSNR